MPHTEALVGPLEHHPACFARVYTLLAGFCDSGSFDVEPLVKDIDKDLSAQRPSLGL